jgi:hypothetical protein
MPSNFPSNTVLFGHPDSAQQKEERPRAQGANGVTIRVMSEEGRLDAAERRRVLDAVAANLKANYVYPDVGQKMSDALRAHDVRGDYQAIDDGGTFAALLAKQLREVSHALETAEKLAEETLRKEIVGPV